MKDELYKNEHTWIRITYNGFMFGYPCSVVTGDCDICHMFPCKHTILDLYSRKVLTDEQLKERNNAIPVRKI